MAFSRHGGSIAEKGAVAFQFDRKGLIRVKGSDDEILMQALEAGAGDVQEEDGDSLIYTDPKELAKVQKALNAANLKVEEAELTFVPNNTIVVSDPSTAGKIMRMMEALDDLDDVSSTHVNFEFDLPQ